MPVTCTAGAGVAVGAKVTSGCGSGDAGTYGVIVASGAGCNSMLSVRDGASYATSAPSARAMAASGIKAVPARTYGAMGNVSAASALRANGEPTTTLNVRPARSNTKRVPRVSLTMRSAMRRAYGEIGATTTPARIVAGVEPSTTAPPTITVTAVANTGAAAG